ncbi:ProP Permeases of the major facilitator superfamily [Mycobacteriaceae bacterium]
MADTTAVPGSWGELLGRDYGRATTVLAGGVALYAINEFITMSLLPSVVADIGGARLYAWVTTVYLVASVVSATTVGPVLARFGPRLSYLGALLFFAGGTAVCATAPSMAALLAGRLIQGLAGGVLAGLGYAVISAALPERLWTRAAAVVSAMWGVGTLIGPASGGVFAQFGLWRWGFGVLMFAALLMAALVPIALPARGGATEQPVRIPVRSLVLLGVAALLVSVAALPRNLAITAGLLGSAAALVVVFVVVDRGAAARVLPRRTFEPGPLKWIYLTMGLLMAATMVDMYAPLFGQRLGALPPAAAGFLGAALSVGWTVAEIRSASIADRRVAARVVRWSPAVMAAGLGLAALAIRDGAGPIAIAALGLALAISGVGIGAAWPHLSVWAMGSVEGGSADDAAERAVAAAAINTVQLMCAAFGAGVAGVVVNVRAQPDAPAAQWLFAVFAGLAAVGWLASSRAARGPR